MYEVTISATAKQGYLLDNLKQSLGNYIRQVGGIATETNNASRCYYTVACRDTFRHQLKRQLTDAVAQTLCVGGKHMFVKELLKAGQLNFYQNLLVNTLCVLDSSTDRLRLLSIINAEADIYLDGYYNFRMGAIKGKWKEIANMVAQNDYILKDNQLILEFLRYLLQTMESKVNCLSICIDNGRCHLYNTDNKVMQTVQLIQPSHDVEQEAMVNALCANPKKVKVYYKTKPTQDFCEIASDLFNTEFIQVV